MVRGMSQEVIDRTTTLVQGFDARVSATPSDAWSKPAPCDGWTARDVVCHVTNNLFRMSEGMGAGAAREVGADEDITTAWHEARDRFLDALPSADMTANMPGPFGPMPAEQMIGRIISTDVLTGARYRPRHEPGSHRSHHQSRPGLRRPRERHAR